MSPPNIRMIMGFPNKHQWGSRFCLLVSNKHRSSVNELLPCLFIIVFCCFTFLPCWRSFLGVPCIVFPLLTFALVYAVHSKQRCLDKQPSARILFLIWCTKGKRETKPKAFLFALHSFDWLWMHCGTDRKFVFKYFFHFLNATKRVLLG